MSTDDLLWRNAQADISFLSEHWEDLLEARLRGTPRPWSEPTVSPQTRAAADAEARLERLERSNVAPGESASPLHVDILDVILELVATAEDLAARTSQAAGVDTPPPAKSALDDPRPHLRHVRAWGPQAGEANPALPQLVATRLARLADTVRAALRLLRDGQTLGAICPWCGGRTPRTPVGGGRTLRVHETLEGLFVACHGIGCAPPEADCGNRWRGRPAWTDAEWDWLAQRIKHADQQRASETRHRKGA